MRLPSMRWGRTAVFGLVTYAALTVFTACVATDGTAFPEETETTEQAIVPVIHAPPDSGTRGGGGGGSTPPPGPTASLAAFWYYDQSVLGSPMVLVRPMPSGTIFLPPTYASANATGGLVHFVWAITGLSATDMKNLAAGTGGWSFGMVDESLQPISSQPIVPAGLASETAFPNLPTGNYLDVIVQAAGLTTLPQTTYLGGVINSWHLQIGFANSLSFQSVLTIGYLFLPAPLTADASTYFSTFVLPTFRDARCSNCHSLGTSSRLVAQHVVNGSALIGPGYVVTKPGSFLNAAGTALGDNLTCAATSGCHASVIADVKNALPNVTFVQDEWKTPATNEDLDWSTMTDHQVCATVLRNLVTTSPPDYSLVQTHFFEDARIAWAVNSGELPAGYVTPSALPVAPPYSYAAFVTAINGWINSGALCPP